MTWKRSFSKFGGSVVGPKKGSNNKAISSSSKYGSFLPEVYSGYPNRVDRYTQMDAMDQDSEVNAALDIIAEFCTQANPTTGVPFNVKYHDNVTEQEVLLLKESLQQWCKLNEFKKRTFRIFRQVLKYGDMFFVRDPETFEWLWIAPQNVERVVVNETMGKVPEFYVVKNLNINLTTQNAAQPLSSAGYGSSMSSPFTSPATGGGKVTMFSVNQPGSAFSKNQAEFQIDAQHMIHISLSEGLDINWPFGNSILELVYKVYKQKELLEDAILIYRIQRAPERRIFYIDVGSMPPHQAMSFIERIKNEIHQKRLPSITGGGSSVMDAGYNPISMSEDLFFPVGAEGRGSKVETLPGGQNLGEIDDLRFFTNKLFRGLKIPSSYLPTGPDDGSAGYNDGKVGVALIQEKRFNDYCLRLQNLIAPIFDREFKVYLKKKGIMIDSSVFDLEFNEPMNFAKYREIEIDNSRMSIFSQAESIPYLSKRFIMKKYLGLTDEEIAENLAMLEEERPIQGGTEGGVSGDSLRNVGITPGDISGDIDLGASAEDDLAGGDLGDLGGDAGGDLGGPDLGGGAPPGPPAGGNPPTL